MKCFPNDTVCENCNKLITKIARWIVYNSDTTVEDVKGLIEKAYKNDGVRKLESDYDAVLKFAKDKE